MEDYELDSYNNLKKILSNRWDFVTMQSEEQLRQSKDRKRDDKQIIDSQERAYWRVYRPPPGYTTVVESSPVPTREQRVKARNRTREHISEEVTLFFFVNKHINIVGKWNPIPEETFTSFLRLQRLANMSFLYIAAGCLISQK